MDFFLKCAKLDKNRKSDFLRKCYLPRYIGLSKIYDKKYSNKLFEIIWDTTDVKRTSRRDYKDFKEFSNNIISIVCFNNDFREFFQYILEKEKVDILLL